MSRPGKQEPIRIGEATLYPAQIASALETTQAAGMRFHSEASGKTLVVAIEMSRNIFGDTLRELEDIRDEIQNSLGIRLGVDVDVKLVEHQQP